MLQDVLAALPLGIFLAFLFGPVFFVLLETAFVGGFILFGYSFSKGNTSSIPKFDKKDPRGRFFANGKRRIGGEIVLLGRKEEAKASEKKSSKDDGDFFLWVALAFALGMIVSG